MNLKITFQRKANKHFALIAIVLLYAISIEAQQTINGTLMHNGIERSYILYVPETYNPSVEAPVVFNFHGYTSNAIQQLNYGDFRPMANEDGFLIVVPEGTVDSQGNTHFNVGWGNSNIDDVGYTEALLDELSTEYNINQKRVYSTGMSNGGFMSYRLACELSNRIAAIASVTGSMTTGTTNSCSPSHPTPILEIHGTADPTVDYNGSPIATSIPDVLNYWTNYNNTNSTASSNNIPDIDPNDGSTVEHIVYTDGDNGVNVEHFKVIGGDHTWPGNNFIPANQDIDASKEIWEFLKKYDIDGLIEPLSVDTFDRTSVSIYPNPAKSEIIINNTNFRKITQYNIITISGQVIMTGEISSKNHQIDISNLSSSMYFLNIGDANFKIIKAD